MLTYADVCDSRTKDLLQDRPDISMTRARARVFFFAHASYTPHTRLLHPSYTPHTRLLHASCTPQTSCKTALISAWTRARALVARLLPCWWCASYTPLTRLLHASCPPLTCLLHDSYTPHTRLLHASCPPLARLLHASSMPLARLLHASGGRRVYDRRGS
jgi:hypothetical protein